MNNLFFIVCIVFIGCATAVIINYLESKKNSKSQEAGIDATAAELEALEERIRVLERIITENKFDLKREIDKL